MRHGEDRSRAKSSDNNSCVFISEGASTAELRKEEELNEDSLIKIHHRGTLITIKLLELLVKNVNTNHFNQSKQSFNQCY